MTIRPRRKKESSEQPKGQRGWPAGYLEETAGRWQGEPLVREPQGE